MMANNGRDKLLEECGELIQVAAKKNACPNTDAHWDGTNLKLRMQEEMGDVLAAMRFVTETHGLDDEAIIQRSNEKLATFRTWHAEPDNHP